ncbi:MAG: protein kinase [Geminicoccaceae bacterium]|nr:protein kinase [Geminicoccaceae bacterium]
MAKVCPTCTKEYGDADLYCPADGTTLQPLSPGDDLIGTVVADRYLITDKIGEGGMGRVYLARHVRLPQNVAIKVLHPGMVRDPSVVARFRREAVNASQIENEHVARVFDHGEIGDALFYIAMEFVEGEPLSKIIAREGALPPARAAEITRQVAEALAAAHERPTPIVHRDLKPDNIMIGARRDGTDRVKVVDFGIAEAMSGGGPKLTQQGLVIGTPEYMSPEQLSAITLDCRSDIYSLGLVTFDMLTGQLPFVGESPHEAALMRLRDRPRTLAEMKSDVSWPPALQAVMDRALARAPADRYATAPEFARALKEAINGANSDAPTAPPPRAENRPAPRPAPERQRTRTAAVGTAAVLGIAVLVSVGLLAWRSRAGNRPESVQPDTAAVSSTTTGSDAMAVSDTTARADTTSPVLASTQDSTAVVTSSSPSPEPRPQVGSPPTGTRPPPTRGPTGSVRDSLDHIESLIVRARDDTVRGRTFARAVLDSARTMVPRLEARDDIVELGVYTTAAYVLLGQRTDACLVLESIRSEAEVVPKFTAQIRLWNDRLDCKD